MYKEILLLDFIVYNNFHNMIPEREKTYMHFLNTKTYVYAANGVEG